MSMKESVQAGINAVAKYCKTWGGNIPQKIEAIGKGTPRAGVSGTSMYCQKFGDKMPPQIAALEAKSAHASKSASISSHKGASAGRSK